MNRVFKTLSSLFPVQEHPKYRLEYFGKYKLAANRRVEVQCVTAYTRLGFTFKEKRHDFATAYPFDLDHAATNMRRHARWVHDMMPYAGQYHDQIDLKMKAAILEWQAHRLDGPLAQHQEVKDDEMTQLLALKQSFDLLQQDYITMYGADAYEMCCDNIMDVARGVLFSDEDVRNKFWQSRSLTRDARQPVPAATQPAASSAIETAMPV